MCTNVIIIVMPWDKNEYHLFILCWNSSAWRLYQSILLIEKSVFVLEWDARNCDTKMIDYNCVLVILLNENSFTLYCVHFKFCMLFNSIISIIDQHHMPCQLKNKWQANLLFVFIIFFSVFLRRRNFNCEILANE